MAMIAAGAASYAQTEAGSIMLGGSLGFGTSGGSTEISGATAGNSTTDAPKTKSFSFSPSGAYFIIDNLAVGAGVSFGTSSNTTKKSFNKTTGAIDNPPANPLGTNDVAFDDKTTNTGFGINLFANKFNDLNDKWKWYYGANLGFSKGSSKVTTVKEATPGSGFSASEVDGPKSTNIGFGVNMGVTYFLTENWAFFGGLNNLLALNYTATKQETALAPSGTRTTKTNNLNLTLATGNVTSGAVNFGVFYFLR